MSEAPLYFIIGMVLAILALLWAGGSAFWLFINDKEAPDEQTLLHKAWRRLDSDDSTELILKTSMVAAALYLFWGPLVVIAMIVFLARAMRTVRRIQKAVAKLTMGTNGDAAEK